MTSSALAQAAAAAGSSPRSQGAGPAPSANRPVSALPSPGAATDPFVRLCEASAALGAVLARWGRGTGEADDLMPLFSTLCILAGIGRAPRRIAAAMPAGDQTFDENAFVATLARLGIRARRLRASAPAGAGEIARLFIGRDGRARLLVRDGSGMLHAMDGLGRVDAVPQPRTLGRARSWSFAAWDGVDALSKAQRVHSGQTWLQALIGQFASTGLALLLVAFAAAIASVALPLFTIQIYANVISLGSLQPLGWLVAGMALLVTFEAVLLGERTRILAWVANRLEYLVSSLSFERILKVRPSISERVAVTDQTARLRTFENIREFLTGPAFATLLEAPVSLLALVAIGAVGGWLVAIPLLGMMAHISLFLLLRRRAKVLTNIAADASTETQRVTIETFEKRDALRQAGLQEVWAERMVPSIRAHQSAQMSLRLIGAWGESVSTFILNTSAILLLAAGANAIWTGALGAGGLLATVILGLRVLSPTHMLCLSVQRFEQVASSMKQLDALMEIPLESEEREAGSPLRPLAGAISFLNVGMRSADTRPLFVGLDLQIQPGEIVAITGANGSGKTTILKLLQGLSDLQLGTIRIDGTDLRQLPLDELRRRVGYVPQDPRLFPGTLRENLLFAAPFASDTQLRRVLADIGLLQPIEALPGGLDQRLESGDEAFVSLEFRFKFAMAQAILADSRIVLIDEIPNNLMNGPIGAIFRSVMTSNHRRRTILFVSHRSDDLSLSNRIVSLRYGNVPTISTFKSLVS